MHMSKTTSQWGNTILLLGALALPATAAAQSPGFAESAYAAPLAEEELGDARGGEYHLTQVSQASETASQNGNSVNGTWNGGNWISDSAFSNTSGFATVIQNSGNNVIIQNSLILNVTYAQ